MEDTRVLEFINKHHEESYKNHIKMQNKKSKTNTIQCITLILAVLSLVLVFGNTIKQETQKNLKMCLKNGYTQNECLKDFLYEKRIIKRKTKAERRN